MSKAKERLKQESTKVESLIKETNKSVIELGKYSDSLYKAIKEIQNIFDDIRNVPSDTIIKYKKSKEIRNNWIKQVEKIEEDYQKYKNTKVGTGAAGGLLGSGIATLGPTAAMGVATTFGVASTGTAISTLSGAAATNAALAWLGGGSLAAGGGGMAGGSWVLGLAGPVGWSIALISLLGGGFLWWKAKSEQEKLEKIFILVSERDQANYKLAITELKERIGRIIEETSLLQNAISKIKGFGTDYNSMSEEQQYTLGSYVNLMLSSTQLLVDPIMALQPKVSYKDIETFSEKIFKAENADVFSKLHAFEAKIHKDLVYYFANLIFKIDLDESERNLLAKSYRKNKDFRKEMGVEKDSISSYLMDTVNQILQEVYAKNR